MTRSNRLRLLYLPVTLLALHSTPLLAAETAAWSPWILDRQFGNPEGSWYAFRQSRLEHFGNTAHVIRKDHHAECHHLSWTYKHDMWKRESRMTHVADYASVQWALMRCRRAVEQWGEYPRTPVDENLHPPALTNETWDITDFWREFFDKQNAQKERDNQN